MARKWLHDNWLMLVAVSVACILLDGWHYWLMCGAMAAMRGWDLMRISDDPATPTS